MPHAKWKYLYVENMMVLCLSTSFVTSCMHSHPSTQPEVITSTPLRCRSTFSRSCARVHTRPHILKVTLAVRPGSISHYNNGKAWGGDLGSGEEHTTAAPITMLYCFSPSRVRTCAPVCEDPSACMHLCLQSRLNASRPWAFVRLPGTYAAALVAEDGMCRMRPRRRTQEKIRRCPEGSLVNS